LQLASRSSNTFTCNIPMHTVPSSCKASTHLQARVD
jgi:hypothetical protein